MDSVFYWDCSGPVTVTLPTPTPKPKRFTRIRVSSGPDGRIQYTPENIEAAESRNAAFEAFNSLIGQIQPIDDEFAVTSGNAIPEAPKPSNGPTVPTACGLTRTAHDGERLGRMAWLPGAQD
jgi:hypothetical protein